MFFRMLSLYTNRMGSFLDIGWGDLSVRKCIRAFLTYNRWVSMGYKEYLKIMLVFSPIMYTPLATPAFKKVKNGNFGSYLRLTSFLFCFLKGRVVFCYVRMRY